METDQICGYVEDVFVRHDKVLQHVYEETPKKGLPAINVRPGEGRFLQFLVRACGAVSALEIGTLGGYSGIWIARGLAEGGKLITLEVDLTHAEVARGHFAAAGLAGRVEVRVGDAHETLRRLATAAPFDFVFIDAEKSGYPAYFEAAMALTRPGSVIAAHNALWYGRVMQKGAVDEDTRAMQAFNRQVAEDSRVISTIYPGGDGTLVAVRVK